MAGTEEKRMIEAAQRVSTGQAKAEKRACEVSPPCLSATQAQKGAKCSRHVTGPGRLVPYVRVILRVLELGGCGGWFSSGYNRCLTRLVRNSMCKGVANPGPLGGKCGHD